MGGVIDSRRAPRFEFDTCEPEDLALYADALPKLAAAGMQIPVTWAGERLKIPAPKDGEAVMGAAKQEPSPASGRGQGEGLGKPPTAINRAALAAEPAAPDLTPIDPLTEAMSEQTAPALANLIEQVRAMVAQADSLESLRDALLAAYGDLDSAELARVMALGFSVADLVGRYDSNTESHA